MTNGVPDSLEGQNTTLDRVLSRIAGNDSYLILLMMLGIYVLFTVFTILAFPGADMVSALTRTLQRVTFLVVIYSMLVLALNLHWGYTGLFNIGVAGFMAIGVYSFAILTNPPSASPPGLGVPQWFAATLPIDPGVGFFIGMVVSVLIGMFIAGVVGALAAIPALRLRADYLAIVTVALSEIIRRSLLSQTLQEFTLPGGIELGTGGGLGISFPANPVRAIYYKDATNTGAGLTPIGEAVFGFFEGFNVATSVVVSWTYTLFLVVIVALFFWFLVRLGNSPFGRILKAIREDEEVAQSLGKDTRLAKIKVFMIGCALMGLAAILWEGSKGFTDPTSTTFLPLQTFYVFIALIIGGAGSNTGSILGAALFASLLFEGPVFVTRVVTQYIELANAPNTFAAALNQLFALDIAPFVAYSLENIAPLRFVLVGVVLIVLMKRRPEGLLGHRKEEAASVNLRERTAATDGGVDDE